MACGMSGLDIFALIVLIVLVVAVIAAWVFLGMWPGKVAEARGHPQADAIRVAGWLGVLSMGIIWPIAFIWAHTNRVEVVSLDEQAETGEAEQ